MGNRRPILEWVSELQQRRESAYEDAVFAIKQSGGSEDDIRALLTPYSLTGVEVGVYRGETSNALLTAFPQLTLYMVDPWTEFAENSEYRLSGDGVAKLTQAEADENRRIAEDVTAFAAKRRTILKLTSKRGFERLGGRLFEFAFLDGDHTYDAVAWDAEHWYRLIRQGGILMGHDYGHRRHKGVKKAVDEFAKREQFELVVDDGCWMVVKPLTR